MIGKGTQTPLGTRIEQVLTEARLIIPGGQALFGFQFVAMLTTGFDRLPQTSKIAHAAALGLIALNIVLVMMPAAVHRLSYGGEDSKEGRRMRNVFRFHAVLVRAAAYLEICCARWKNNHTRLVPLRPPGRSRSANGI